MGTGGNAPPYKAVWERQGYGNERGGKKVNQKGHSGANAFRLARSYQRIELLTVKVQRTAVVIIVQQVEQVVALVIVHCLSCLHPLDAAWFSPV